MNNQNQKNIYQASFGEIFLKNFLAGLARGLGSLVLWFLVMFVGYKLLWPQLLSQIDRLTNLVNNLQDNQIIQMNEKIPQNINQLFQNYVPR